jgi:hypothetical protein
MRLCIFCGIDSEKDVKNIINIYQTGFPTIKMIGKIKENIWLSKTSKLIFFRKKYINAYKI